MAQATVQTFTHVIRTLTLNAHQRFGSRQHARRQGQTLPLRFDEAPASFQRLGLDT